ncbi:hypothetical protein ACUHGC_11080 [Testudinibacter sp. P27/CKL/0425]
MRLLPLIKHGFLTEGELKKIALKIWGDNPDYQDIPEIGLLSYVLLELPSHDLEKVQHLIRKYLFEPKDEYLFNWSFLMDVANAAQAENVKEFPTEQQAIYLFDKLVSWKIELDENDFLGYANQVKNETAKLITHVLSCSIVPALPIDSINEENFQKLYSLYIETKKPEILRAFVYFSASDNMFVERVENIIKKSLQSLDANELAHVSYAILVWRDLQNSSVVDGLIKRFIYFIASNRIQGLAQLLWGANQMYKKQYLSSEDIESLIEILPIIFDSSGYERIAPYSKESVSISVVRAACVKLARDILKDYPNNINLVKILDMAKQDPLPEVRFAEFAEE